LGGGGGVCTGKGGLDVLGLAIGKDDLFEVEAEGSGAPEGAGRFRLSYGADDGSALWYSDGVIGVVDGLGDDGLDRLA
jgi:hypothetical protein